MNADCVPCVPYKYRNEKNFEDYARGVEEYIVEQCEFEIKDDVIILPEEFEYRFGGRFLIPDKYTIHQLDR